MPDNWLVVVMMAFWLLFTAKEEVTYQPKKWRQYKESKTDSQQDQKEMACLSPNQVRQAAQDLFLTFDSTPFLPKTANKGKGRTKDRKFTPRIRHPIVKKSTKKAKMKPKIEKKE